MLIFRPLFDPSSSTWSYLLGDQGSGEAVLIDPVFEQLRRDETLIRELGLQLKWTLETHVHADHVTGAWLLRQRLGSRIALSVDGGASGADRLLRHGEHVAFGTHPDGRLGAGTRRRLLRRRQRLLTPSIRPPAPTKKAPVPLFRRLMPLRLRTKRRICMPNRA